MANPDVYGDFIGTSSTISSSSLRTWQRDTISSTARTDLPTFDAIARDAELTPEKILLLRQLTYLLRLSVYFRIGAAFASLFATQLTEEEKSVLVQILNGWWDDEDQEHIRLALAIGAEFDTSQSSQDQSLATVEPMFTRLACSTGDPSLLFWASGVQTRSRFNTEAIFAIETRRDGKKAEMLRIQISALEEQFDALRRENDEAAKRLRDATHGTYSEERALEKTKHTLEELIVAD